MKPLLFTLLLFYPPWLMAQTDPQGDGVVRIFNYHLNEFAEVTFRDKGHLVTEGVAKAQQLLRSRDQGGIVEIDIRLLDLIDHLQDHFEADQIEIISGYRSRELNTKLLKEGHAVSAVSLHMQGKALDIHIDEIREETLRDYLLGLKLGGVGYYGPLDFVHVDVGEVRHWSTGDIFPRKLVGVLNEKAPLQLTSDKNDYLSGETLHFQWSSQPVPEMRLEHFRRGQWESVTSPPILSQGSTMLLRASDFKNAGGTLRYGKYRWLFKITGGDEILSSNEFYIKKQ